MLKRITNFHVGTGNDSLSFADFIVDHKNIIEQGFGKKAFWRYASGTVWHFWYLSNGQSTAITIPTLIPFDVKGAMLSCVTDSATWKPIPEIVSATSAQDRLSVTLITTVDWPANMSIFAVGRYVG